MKAISQFVVSVFDLIEAEGRSFRAVARAEARSAYAALVEAAMALTFVLVSVPLFVAGACLLAAGLMWWLETQVSRPAAAAITGVVVLALAASCLFVVRSLTHKKDQ